MTVADVVKCVSLMDSSRVRVVDPREFALLVAQNVRGGSASGNASLQLNLHESEE